MRLAKPITEKYRPHRLEQLRGHDKAVKILKGIIDRPDFDGGAFWVEGPTGTGKTCIAHGIADRLHVKRGAWNYTEIDGDRCSVEAVRALDDQSCAAGLWADVWRITVVNEAHLITGRAVGAWLTLLERLPFRWVVVFTTTEESSGLFGPMGKPMIDRCSYIRLSNQGLCGPFAALAHRIAGREHLNGQPVSAYVAALKRSGVRNSMRALLAMIARGEFCAE